MTPSPMTPSPAERDALFTAFARALFKRDLDAPYKVVTPDFVWSYHDGLSLTRVLSGPDAIAAHMDERKAFYADHRFHDVVYHHLPEATFMTFRVSETVRATGEIRAQSGIERYVFKDGRIALKDVYRKPA